MNKNLITFHFEQASGHFKEPNINDQYLDERTKTAIRNAWDTCSIIDNFGKIWIQVDSLHTLIRTIRSQAHYLIGGISDEDKYRQGDILYIRGTAVYQLLDHNLQNAGSMQREQYIRFSELFYIAIRDCSRARVLRSEFYEFLKRILGKLKLIVNKTTHAIITQNQINDEHELNELCILNNWNIDWYNPYTQIFNK